MDIILHPEPSTAQMPSAEQLRSIARRGYERGYTPIPLADNGDPLVRGHHGGARRPDAATVTNTISLLTDGCGLAWSLPSDRIGIDIDHYISGETVKTGWSTIMELEQRLGPLPVETTWYSTRRGAQDRTGGVWTGIALFRLPPEIVPNDGYLRTRGVLGECVEIISYHQRFLRAAPTVRRGLSYRWHGPNGYSDELPPIGETLPLLPDAWVAHVLGDRTVAGNEKLAVGGGAPTAPRGIVTWLKPSLEIERDYLASLSKAARRRYIGTLPPDHPFHGEIEELLEIPAPARHAGSSSRAVAYRENNRERSDTGDAAAWCRGHIPGFDDPMSDFLRRVVSRHIEAMPAAGGRHDHTLAAITDVLFLCAGDDKQGKFANPGAMEAVDCLVEAFYEAIGPDHARRDAAEVEVPSMICWAVAKVREAVESGEIVISQRYFNEVDMQELGRLWRERGSGDSSSSGMAQNFRPVRPTDIAEVPRLPSRSFLTKNTGRGTNGAPGFNRIPPSPRPVIIDEPHPAGFKAIRPTEQDTRRKP